MPKYDEFNDAVREILIIATSTDDIRKKLKDEIPSIIEDVQMLAQTMTINNEYIYEKLHPFIEKNKNLFTKINEFKNGDISFLTSDKFDFSKKGLKLFKILRAIWPKLSLENRSVVAEKLEIMIKC
jgi:flagellin-like hook-associated protein FlgL